MQREMKISVFEVVGSALCVASDDGQKVHDRLAAVLEAGHRAVLSFRNVSTMTSAFLNAAIGQLYGNFDEAHIRSQLKVRGDGAGRCSAVKACCRDGQAVF